MQIKIKNDEINNFLYNEGWSKLNFFLLKIFIFLMIKKNIYHENIFCKKYSAFTEECAPPVREIPTFIFSSSWDWSSEGWGSGKVFLNIVFEIQDNLIMMISNTIEMLFIVYSNTFLQKDVFFPHVIFSSSLIYGHF